MFGVRASRRAVIVAATVAVLLVVLIAARHLIVRAVLETTLSVATGYSVRIGSQTLGTHHGVLFDVHVAKNGDPVLDAQRVDVEYALRDIFPGGAHRFGFAAISIQKPVLTITRHADGTLTFNRVGGTSAAAPPPTRKAAAPYYFTARVRDGVVRLVDEAPLQTDLANQTIENVSIDASVKSDARTTARLDGVLVGRRAAGAPVTRYPLALRSIIDVQRGIGLNTITARELPLRGVLGFLVHSKSIRFDDGVLSGVDARVFALAPQGDDFRYRLGGHADLRDGRLAVSALAHEVRNLDASFVIADDMFSSTALHATLGGIPVRGRGALYGLFGTPSLWLGFTADADLHVMRSLFGFTAKLPLSGRAHFETLLESSISQPLIHTAFTLPHLRYDRFPIDALDGVVDYRDNAVVIDGLRGRFGSVSLALGGRVLVNDAGDDVQLALSASGAGAALPYTDLLAPDSNVRAVALFTQPPGDAFRVRGTIATVGPTRGAGTFAVTPLGRRRVRPVPVLARRRIDLGRRVRARAPDLTERRLAVHARLPARRRATARGVAGRADSVPAPGRRRHRCGPRRRRNALVVRPRRNDSRPGLARRRLRAGQRQRAARRNVQRRSAGRHSRRRTAGSLRRRGRVLERAVRARR